jgi:hypothetical protein
MHTQTHEARLHTIVRSDGTQRDRMTLVDPKLDNPPVDLPAPTGGLWTKPPPRRAAASFEEDRSSMRGAAIGFALAGVVGAALLLAFAPKIGAALLGLLAFWGAR